MKNPTSDRFVFFMQKVLITSGSSPRGITLRYIIWLYLGCRLPNGVNLGCISNDASFELDEKLSETINYLEPMVIAANKARSAAAHRRRLPRTWLHTAIGARPSIPVIAPACLSESGSKSHSGGARLSLACARPNIADGNWSNGFSPSPLSPTISLEFPA